MSVCFSVESPVKFEVIAILIFLLGEIGEDATNWVGEVALGCIERLFRDNLYRGWHKPPPRPG